MFGALAVVLLLIGFYVVSLLFNPWVTCSKCKGKARPRAWVFGYAHHVCPKCGGTGQQERFGRRLFRMGPGKPSS
jgi:DnaJ-class molecular chaperone